MRKFIRRHRYLAITLIVAILAGSFFGGRWIFQKYQRYRIIHRDDMTLSEAARIGETTTHKLMVQIETPKGNPEDTKSRYQRGDIVLIKSGDFEFSDAEKTGFLILRMDLTQRQTELLVRSLQRDSGKSDPQGQPQLDNLARRRFSVDLEKIGLDSSNQSGREITDKIFKWDIVNEKKT